MLRHAARALCCALLLGGAACRNGPTEPRAVKVTEPPPAAANAPAPPPPAPAAPPAAAASSAPACAPQPFAQELPIAEASGAVVTTIDGQLTVMVIADSGHDGDYLLVDPQTGAVRERGKLPLGERGDDLEGLAVRGDRFWALTSSGWLRAWVRRGPPAAPPGFDLVEGPVPISAGKAPAATACDLAAVNCGRNFEGLCLLPNVEPAPRARRGGAADCVGMAASKTEGRLYCVIERDGHLTLDPQRTIAVTKPGALADCNIDGETLWVGSNLFDLNRVRRIDGWRTPAQAQLVELGPTGVGFCEAIAVAGQTMYRFSDTQGTPSLVAKFHCSPAATSTPE